MANVKLTPDQEDLVRKAAKSEGFTDFDISANIGTIKGDNYLGVIHSVTVKEKNDGTKVLHLICKSAHVLDNFRAMVPIIKMFKRESDLYEIIGKLKKYQNEKALSRPFDGVAKFYGSCLEEKKETILMKNLKKDGYKLWDRMTPMNDEHLSAVFAEYARFHALSFAFKHQNPDGFEELSKDIKTDVFMDIEKENAKEKFEQWVQYYFKNGLNTVEGNAKATAELEKLREVIGQRFEILRMTKRAVITHGDCWCNNILFKYENNNNTPAKVCFIDWQLSKVGSPALDLAYFLSASGSKETYPNINKYLKIYHETLSQNLQELGCNPEEIFSFDDVLDEWKKTAWYGVFIGMMVLKIMLTESEEVPDYEKLNPDDMTAFSYEVKRSADYKQRLCDLIEFMADYGYL